MRTELGTGTRPTPVGSVRFAVGEGGALVALGFEDRWEPLAAWLSRRFGEVRFVSSVSAERVGRVIDAYLAGDVGGIDGLAVDLGGTEFQRRVWAALRAIPAGTTCSYSAIAKVVGAPRAVRAVGTANGDNPVSIVVPCHRVIGADGALRGYGGGLHRKEWLLAHEARAAQTPASPGWSTASSTQA
jgi:methylated-DNA-[protein]-cysteine S-methyltransferase